jgi:hypothetical protein
MPRRRRSTLAVSAEQARQALGVLVQEGKIKAGEVMKALQRRDRLIKALKASLAALESGVGSVGSRLFGGRASQKARKPRTSATTRKVYQQRQQQGRYMAALRPLSKAQRAKVKAIRGKSGARAAIAAAMKMAG